MVPTLGYGPRTRTACGLTPDPLHREMTPGALAGNTLGLMARYQGYLKWPIYSLLFINFLLYLGEDYRTLAREGYQSVWDITGAFATSLDVAGWFGLLLVFEIETYWQQVYARPRIRVALNLLRWGCFAILAHTLVVYTADFAAVLDAEPTSVDELFCSTGNGDLYTLNNQVYTPLPAAECLGLANGEQRYWSFEAGTLVDAHSLRIATVQGAASFVECLAWLAAGLAFAALAWMQRRNITGGLLPAAIRQTPHISYLLIISCALSWGWYGHYLYTYDSLLWLGGFAMIEANLSAWQSRIQQLVGAKRVVSETTAGAVEHPGAPGSEG